MREDASDWREAEEDAASRKKRPKFPWPWAVQGLWASLCVGSGIATTFAFMLSLVSVPEVIHPNEGELAVTIVAFMLLVATTVAGALATGWSGRKFRVVSDRRSTSN